MVSARVVGYSSADRRRNDVAGQASLASTCADLGVSVALRQVHRRRPQRLSDGVLGVDNAVSDKQTHILYGRFRHR
jgi:hypothetical protein